MPTGYTLDTATADVDFNALLSGLAHVLYPVSYSEAAKLLDLEHDHDFYHVTINEILFSILPHPLRGNALSVYHECARHHPADGRYALQRLRYEVEEDQADTDRVADLWHILSESAKQSPYVAPLYLVVLRELRAGAVFTFSRLTLRIRLAFRDESPLATLSPSATPDIPPEGSGYRPKSAPQKPSPSPRSPTAMALRAQKQSLAPLEGKWTADSPASMYRNPNTPAPPTEQPTAAAFHSVRLSLPALGGGDAIGTVDSGSLVVHTTDDAASPLPDGIEEPACYGAVFPDEDDTDWPAFRSSPVWLPNSAVTGDVNGKFPQP
ncbi:hypothetical protein CYMTET_47358 [Cymbomonas tetramitiformis]|uniref:Uncharacterized protein n=1 Tax=Cymbomonas tetramitiformis TaxID=36881 RepID=A0AAE0BUE6_9CHLO|nr:hypothetical protein CYMTET_47358 [Cymbomonas tetramitiformis]